MPRLFVAINFSKDIVEELYAGTVYLKNNSTSSKPSRKENLHLTLAFIGESPKVKNAVSALKSVNCVPFDLTVEGFGKFSSKDGSICFAKVKETPTLSQTAEKIRDALVAYGFDIDTKPFIAHITLCRQFVPSPSFRLEDMRKLLSQKTARVTDISLMRSDRIGGKLTYTEIFKKIL